ncbi:unnamed protein product [Amaranthus hypochondriacus]
MNPCAIYKMINFGIGVLSIVGAIWSMFSNCPVPPTMMNAPGQPGVRILRDVFEKDPSAYFRNLRNM